MTCAWHIPAQLPGALVGLMKVGSSSGALNALRRDARTCTSAVQGVDCHGLQAMSRRSCIHGRSDKCGSVLQMRWCSQCCGAVRVQHQARRRPVIAGSRRPLQGGRRCRRDRWHLRGC